MKIGSMFSDFDLLYSSDIKMPEDANRQCSYLIIDLQTDQIDKPKKNAYSCYGRKRYAI